MPGDRQDLRRRVQSVAFGQAGYFTAAQAHEAGYSYQAQKYHVDHGNWVRVDRGLFRLPDWPSQPEDVYARWVVWSRGLGVISHETALLLHGLSDVNPTTVHLSVPPGFRARDKAVTLHVAAVPEGDIEVRASFTMTGVERTLLDVAESRLSQELLDQAVEDALRRGLTSARRLRRRADGSNDRAALGIERALSANGAHG